MFLLRTANDVLSGHQQNMSSRQYSSIDPAADFRDHWVGPDSLLWHVVSVTTTCHVNAYTYEGRAGTRSSADCKGFSNNPKRGGEQPKYLEPDGVPYG